MSQPSQASPITAPHDAAVARVEIFISNLLRAGVTLSLAIILIGTAVSFVRHRDYMRDPNELKRLTAPGAAFPHTIRQVLDGVMDLRGQAIVAVGLLVLIATPVMRVAVSILAFVYQRDSVFVAVTTVVFLLLLLSFFLGKVEG